MEQRERVLPEGNLFGTVEDDEFNISINGGESGVFKRFQYPKALFSATNNQKLFEQVLEESEQSGNSFNNQMGQNEEVKQLLSNVSTRMRNNPMFSKEIMDNLLAQVYVDDNIIADISTEDNLESKMAKFTAGWKHISDFYAIEGLVGGDAEHINPFLDDENSSRTAGALDSLETVLPALRNTLSDEEWARTKLQLSSVVEREASQIEHATNVLNHIHGKKEYDQEFLQRSRQRVDELAHNSFESNVDLGKFYNTFIRFHNWMPLNIKDDGPEGDQYDSICAPAKEGLEYIQDLSVHDSLNEIGDATSPKGLALSWLIDEELEVDGEKIGDREKFAEEEQRFQKEISEMTGQKRSEYSEITFEDPAMYSGLTGGKWKGLKLLQDTKEQFDLDYEVPDGRVITSIGIDMILEDAGIAEILEDNQFTMDERTRQEVVQVVDEVDVSQYFDLEEGSIMRSSMYGEDGGSNFAGTYESFLSEENPESAFKNVIKSYFSEKAVKAREDKGLTHEGGISVIVQEAVTPEEGGVLHLAGEEYNLSTAENPEKAVEGLGDNRTSSQISELVEGTALEGIESELRELHETFGDIDLEYVANGDEVYLTQMRPKYSVAESLDQDLSDYERISLDAFDEIHSTDLNGSNEYVVEMSFLGRENVMDRVDELNNFIRENEDKIAGIEGEMPRVAHIPNNIESHYGIPYKKAEN